MNYLTDKDIDFITKEISKSEIVSSDLKDDLIDHFCCAIEEDMKKGKDFQKSYDKAYQNICPDGFDEIQRETVFLLTLKKLKTMKQLLYVSGYLSAIGLTTSLFMKYFHIAGGAIALFSTFVLLIFVFLPSLFLNLYKRELTKSLSNKLKYVFGFFGVALLLVGVLFKIMHWPFGTATLLLAILVLNFAFFPFLFFKMYRKSIN